MAPAGRPFQQCCWEPNQWVAIRVGGRCWNPGIWVPKIGPITQGPIIGTEYIGTLIGSPRLSYARGFTMTIISNNIRDMFMQSIHVQQDPPYNHSSVL